MLRGCDSGFWDGAGGFTGGIVGDAGSGAAYTEETPQEQSENCKTNQAIRQALRDPDVRANMNKALTQAHSVAGGNGFWEYGFWTSPAKSGNDVIAWSVGTDRQIDHMFPDKHSPWKITQLIYGANSPNVFLHTHSGGALSQADVDYAKANGISIVAFNKDGTKACFPS